MIQKDKISIFLLAAGCSLNLNQFLRNQLFLIDCQSKLTNCIAKNELLIFNLSNFD